MQLLRAVVPFLAEKPKQKVTRSKLEATQEITIEKKFLARKRSAVARASRRRQKSIHSTKKQKKGTTNSVESFTVRSISQERAASPVIKKKAAQTIAKQVMEPSTEEASNEAVERSQEKPTVSTQQEFTGGHLLAAQEKEDPSETTGLLSDLDLNEPAFKGAKMRPARKGYGAQEGILHKPILSLLKDLWDRVGSIERKMPAIEDGIKSASVTSNDVPTKPDRRSPPDTTDVLLAEMDTYTKKKEDKKTQASYWSDMKEGASNGTQSGPTSLSEKQAQTTVMKQLKDDGLSDATSGRIKAFEQKKVQLSEDEVAEIRALKKEMEEARKQEQEREAKEKAKPPVEQKKPEAPPPPVKKVALPKPKGEFSRFLASLQYMGLKKQGLSFIQNLATMLNAGLPLVDSLKALQRETRTKPMKKLMQRILDAVENGSAFWRALDSQQFFSPHAISLVRIGEEAGNLAQNMQYLAEQQEKDHALRSKVKMAMIYPTIVLTLMFFIVIGLGMFVLPNLISVLFSLNVPLPLVTRLVIQFSNFFTTYGTVGVPSFIGGVILLIILAKFTSLKVVTQWIAFRIPGIGALATEATIARFGVILGGLLEAGVPLVDALHSLVEVTPIISYKKFYARLLEHIILGDSFTKAFTSIRGSEKLLPISVQQLVMTGEKSGSLSRIMLKIADIYEKKAN
ncbi:MAG: hypothetical protein RIQ56_390, partial [Candidatus Parcubacteria bacterium]